MDGLLFFVSFFALGLTLLFYSRRQFNYFNTRILLSRNERIKLVVFLMLRRMSLWGMLLFAIAAIVVLKHSQSFGAIAISSAPIVFLIFFYVMFGWVSEIWTRVVKTDYEKEVGE